MTMRISFAPPRTRSAEVVFSSVKFGETAQERLLAAKQAADAFDMQSHPNSSVGDMAAYYAAKAATREALAEAYEATGDTKSAQNSRRSAQQDRALASQIKQDDLPEGRQRPQTRDD
jgi:hypothetical protein